MASLKSLSKIHSHTLYIQIQLCLVNMYVSICLVLGHPSCGVWLFGETNLSLCTLWIFEL